jgi:hypothetical protein
MPYPPGQGNGPYSASVKHAIGIGLCAATMFVLAVTGWKRNTPQKGYSNGN